jgi:hypothetical protein
MIMSDFNTEGFNEWWAEAKKLYDGDSGLCALRAWQHQQQEVKSVREAFNAALDFALDNTELNGSGDRVNFLSMWREGLFNEIAEFYKDFDLTTINQK